MPETEKPSIFTRIMSAGCSICPFCIAARIWPNSCFARRMHRLERTCPWCRAYNRLHGVGTDADNEDETQPTT